MTVSKWGFFALFILCSAALAEIYSQCQKYPAIKLYEEAFIHSMNGQWQKAKEASDCLLRLQNQPRWKIEASDLLAR